jgi:SOS-response transcriptional repressor LexA
MPLDPPESPDESPDPSPDDVFSAEAAAASQRQLTHPQRRILDAITFFRQKGELPTVREVGALVGLRSPATVLKHLRALERAGLISINGKSRGIRLTALFTAPFTDAEDVGAADSGESVEAAGNAPQKIRGIGRIVPSFPSLSRGIPFPGIPFPGIPLVGAIAAGRPFESYYEAFLPDGILPEGAFPEGALPEGVGDDGPYSASSPAASSTSSVSQQIAIDPKMFSESGDVFALQIEGDSMVNAGILDGDYVIIRRQNTVEDGEIAAVIINGEGTLKRWRTGSEAGIKAVTLLPANERFEPIEITEEDAKDVLVIGKYVGLVRGNLRFL